MGVSKKLLDLEWFLRVNKYRVGAVGVTLSGLALSMHFVQQGLTATRWNMEN